MKEFRGCKMPEMDEPDYDSLRIAHCNSMKEEDCDSVECEDCLYDENNIDIFRAWIDKNVAIKRKE